MEMFKIIILAIEQGITELLPISSSAHLILTAELFKIEMDTYLLSVLHLGSTIAIIIFFLPTLLKDILKRDSLLFYAKLIVSTIPIAVIGLIFESTIENILRGNIVIVISLIIWGILMIFVERRYKDIKEQDLHEISWKQSITMGLAQILALIPGTSRSGVTTIAGIFSGINKYTALQYSFILGIPILLGTSVFELIKHLPKEGLSATHLVGILVSGIFGLMSLQFLKKIKKEKWLTIFGYYRIFLGILILLFIIL